MKTPFLFILTLSTLALAAITLPAVAGPWVLRENADPEIETAPVGFLLYLKDGSNPNREDILGGHANKVYLANSGLEDVAGVDRYFPYSTPAGRRIGFGLPVPTATATADYYYGITTTQADTRLANAVTAAVNALKSGGGGGLGNTVWESLDIYCQEMLVDCAISECLQENGNFDLTKMSTLFKDTVVAQKTLANCKAALILDNNMSYVRKYGPLINILKNRAFAYRFLGGGTPYHH